MRILTRVILFCCGALFVGCANPAGSSGPTITTKKWEVLNGAYQFYTNDTANYGWGFWHPTLNTNANAVFTSMTGIAKRVSGATNQGYGFLFCYADSSDFYRVMIDATGYYRIDLKYAGNYTVIQDWTATTALVTGLNVMNTVQVTRNASGVFTLAFNGTTATTFTNLVLSFDGFATYASVGDATNEQFPMVPEDVRLSFTAPTTLPGAGKSISANTYQLLPAETGPEQETRRP